MKKATPFASRLQQILIALLLLSLALIAQQFSKAVYQAGLVLLIVSTILQIGASNVPPSAGAKQTGRIMLIALVIVAIVFGLGIFLAPYLIHLGQR